MLRCIAHICSAYLEKMWITIQFSQMIYPKSDRLLGNSTGSNGQIARIGTPAGIRRAPAIRMVASDPKAGMNSALLARL